MTMMLSHLLALIVLVAAAEAGIVLVTDLLACAEGALATAVAATGLLLGGDGIGGLGLLALGRLLGLGLHVFILGLGLRRRGGIDVDLHHGLGLLHVHLLLVRLGLLGGLLLGPAGLGGVGSRLLSSGLGGSRLLSGGPALLVGGRSGLATGNGGLLGGLGLASGRCGTSHCGVVVVGSNGTKMVLVSEQESDGYLDRQNFGCFPFSHFPCF